MLPTYAGLLLNAGCKSAALLSAQFSLCAQCMYKYVGEWPSDLAGEGKCVREREREKERLCVWGGGGGGGGEGKGRM